MRLPRPSTPRMPVWAWRVVMAHRSPGETRRFNLDPLTSVSYTRDVDYAGAGDSAQSLDVIAPLQPAGPLPVYVYFHGGGWTSGDKRTLTKYCAIQANTGMVVVNVNYRPASRAHMGDILHDANDALAWVRRSIGDFQGDPQRIVLGGDSAGGQIAALLAASGHRPELADHYGITPAVPDASIRGVVQHCSAVDFSVIFERGFVMGLHFVRMLLPTRVANHLLPHAARFLSPIEWLDEGFPPVLVTTSEHDFFYQANLNFIARLRSAAVPVETLVFDRSHRRAKHTWQQDDRIAESHAVYRRVQQFVVRVTAPHPA